jgi:hypothetical protein
MLEIRSTAILVSLTMPAKIYRDILIPQGADVLHQLVDMAAEQDSRFRPFGLHDHGHCPSSEFSGEPRRFHNGGTGSVSV